MKKIFLLLLLSVFLSGCSVKETARNAMNSFSSSEYTITNRVQLSVSSLDISQKSYTTFLKGFSGCKEVVDQENTYYHCDLLPGYIHILNVSHMGIKLTYDQHYDAQDQTLFLQEAPKPFLATTKDSVYSIQNPDVSIKMISKKPNQSIEDMVKTFVLPQNCVLNSQVNESNSDIIVYDGSTSPGCLDSNGKYPIYLFSKTKSDYYYLWNDNLDCSNHPCSVFDTPYIEIFLK